MSNKIPEIISTAKQNFAACSLKKKIGIIASCFILLFALFNIGGGTSGNSIDKGFRGIPWGTSLSEAKKMGLKKGNSDITYVNQDENLSLGNVSVSSIEYAFDPGESYGHRTDGYPSAKFCRVTIYFRTNYAKNIADECVKLFGNPTFSSNTDARWDFDRVTVYFTAKVDYGNGGLIVISLKDPNEKKI